MPYRAPRVKGTGAPEVTRHVPALTELKELIGTTESGVEVFAAPPTFANSDEGRRLTCDGVYKLLVAFARNRDKLRDFQYDNVLTLRTRSGETLR